MAHKHGLEIVFSCNNGKAIETFQAPLEAQSLVLLIPAKSFLKIKGAKASRNQKYQQPSRLQVPKIVLADVM